MHLIAAMPPMIMDEPMNRRAQYGELQMSFVTTSLLLLFHVPPVVLLGIAFDRDVWHGCSPS